ncbi:hypothetical protein [Mycobacterium sp. PSTR-4-N]|uniref:hypothetical protein n=1 Tax=Mycobacterium sp. PSTR-4-N TaxID=2917745 RepID=UPI001F15336E|nr:hypothetical protein [Mycobacterium sp. PSTR-4-N]MCG7592430.1 hypothetical protein [Mycobacterium sp. PSTR-4-N]
MSDSMKKEEAREFASVLIQHKNGLAHDEATEALKQAVIAAEQTGKAASVTVTLTVEPIAKIPGAYKIKDKVDAKIPTEPRSSMWFSDTHGGLYKNDPNQRSLYDDTPAEASDGKSAAAGRD